MGYSAMGAARPLGPVQGLANGSGGPSVARGVTVRHPSLRIFPYDLCDTLLVLVVAH